MRMPIRRLAVTIAAVSILAVAGIGFAAASGVPGVPAAEIAVAEGTAVPGASARPREGGQRLRDGGRPARFLRAGHHLVHAEVTVTDRDGNLVNLQFDHGTVQSIGGGNLVIAEAGGGTVTVSTSDGTIVRIARARGDLGDVTVGAEVFVQSRIDGGAVLARRIVVVPASAG